MRKQNISKIFFNEIKMKKLYPIKFEPILFEKVWGGNNLNRLLNKKNPNNLLLGESWEIAQLEDVVSVVKNGYLQDNTLEDLIEIYMNELLGDQVYAKYGLEFPLLFKFIDANDKLSIQLHPDNEVAQYRHNAYGKTEMWYVVDAEPGAQIIIGFKEELDKYSLQEKIDDNTLVDYLKFEDVKRGDVFFIPSGTVHALLKGIVVAEIQQNSDITYRLYDWGRMGLDGVPRQLHVDLALDVVDYQVKDNYRIKYEVEQQSRVQLVACPYFTTNLIEFSYNVEFNYRTLDSFVVYMCLEGRFDLIYNQNEHLSIEKGETVLIPAEFEEVLLKPYENCRVLETYIPFVYVEVEND